MIDFNLELFFSLIPIRILFFPNPYSLIPNPYFEFVSYPVFSPSVMVLRITVL